MISQLVYKILVSHFCNKTPDCVIGTKNDSYLIRWWIIPKNKVFNIYLHKFMRSDDDTALHDHPWVWASWILKNRYIEHSFPYKNAFSETTVAVVHNEGSIRFNRAKKAHRIEIMNNEPIWTLFFTGPKIREWGFHTKNGWVHWKKFVNLTQQQGNCQ